VTFRILAGAFALLFLLCAVVQWNDPDPARWMLLYGAVAVLSTAAAFGVRARVPTLIVFVAILVAFAFWAPSLRYASLEALQSFGMSGSVQEEEVREAVGLALASIWTAALLVGGFRGPDR
jgi:hypothetical protein